MEIAVEGFNTDSIPPKVALRRTSTDPSDAASQVSFEKQSVRASPKVRKGSMRHLKAQNDKVVYFVPFT
jgi:hypothetical protein